MRILVLNGPNLNMLGIREPGIYGRKTYHDLLMQLDKAAGRLGVELVCMQSNHEGALVDMIQAAYGKYDAIVINPAAYTHTSIAIPDALKAVGLPAVEVHISDINARESFRKISYTSAACVKTIAGHGLDGYTEALEFLASRRQLRETAAGRRQRAGKTSASARAGATAKTGMTGKPAKPTKAEKTAKAAKPAKAGK